VNVMADWCVGLGAISCALLIHGAATAQTAIEPMQSTTLPLDSRHLTPEWLQRATGVDLKRVYPRAALKQGLEGVVLISCRVSKAGGMMNCTVDQEAPAGHGFGDAALKLMPKFRMQPTTRDGTAVEGGVVRLPIQFRFAR